MKIITIAAALTALALTGCGDDKDSAKDNAGPFDSSDTPDCTDVLVVGEALPDPYEGCVDSDGDLKAVLVYDDGDCGRELWVVDDNLWAYADDRIVTDVDIWSECYGYAEESESAAPPAVDTSVDVCEAVNDLTAREAQGRDIKSSDYTPIIDLAADANPDVQEAVTELRDVAVLIEESANGGLDYIDRAYEAFYSLSGACAVVGVELVE